MDDSISGGSGTGKRRRGNFHYCTKKPHKASAVVSSGLSGSGIIAFVRLRVGISHLERVPGV